MTRVVHFFTASIQRKILSGFALIIFLVLAIVIASYYQLQQIENVSEQILPISSQMDLLHDFALSLSVLDADVERFLVIGGLQFQENVFQDLEDMADRLNTLQETAPPEMRPPVTELAQITTGLKTDMLALTDSETAPLDSKEINERIIEIYEQIDKARQVYQQLSAEPLKQFREAVLKQKRIISQLITQLTIFGFLVFLIAVAASILVTRSIATPLARLAQSATQIAGGNLKAQTKVNTQDETGRLGTAFNDMTIRLRHLIGSLEQEIAEREQVEKELRESEARFRTLAENVPGVIYICLNDERYTMLYLNDAIEELTGYPKEEFLSGRLSFVDLYHRPDITFAIPAPSDAVYSENKKPFHYEYRIRHRSGQLRWIEEWGWGVFDQQHNFMFLEGFFLDITGRKQAEAAAVEEHNLLRTLINQMPDAIYIKDAESRFLVANRSIGHIMGTTPDELIGKTDFDFFPEELARQYYADEQTVIKSGQALIDKEELVYGSETDKKRWFSTTKVPFQDSQGQIKGIVGIGRDMTDRLQMEQALQKARDELETRVEQRTAELRKANEQLAALYKVGQTITAPLQLDIVLEVIVHSTANLLESDTGVILLVDETGQTLSIKGAYGLSRQVVKETHDRIGESIAGRVVQTGQPIIANDLPNDPRFYNPAAATEGLLACASAPLMVGQKIIGTLDVHSKTNRYAFDQKHLQILNMLASQAAIAIENARLYEELQQAHDDLEERVRQRTVELVAANEQLQQEIAERLRTEEALRASEERFRALYRDNPSMFFTIDAQGTVISVNNFGASQLGYTVDELEGQPVLNIFYDDDKPAVIEQIQNCLQNPDQVYTWQYRKVCKNGDLLWVEEFARALRNPAGALNVLIVCHDITGRKQAEGEIQRRNRELTLLNRVIAASVTANNAKTILEITCRELALAFNLPQAAAVLLDDKKTEAIVVAEYLSKGRPAVLGQIIPLADFPLAHHILSHRAPLVVEDAQNNPRLSPIRHLVQQRRTMSLAFVPLIIDGKVIGCLSLEATEPHPFSAEEINLAGSVANQVAGVLARLRLDEQRRQLQAQYHQSQKMEAIGQLTGGVAHDFNNILTIILGNCGFILDDLNPQHPLHADIQQIQNAAERAASLTRQLLAFSRQQILQPRVLNLNNIVVNIEKMLRRLIGEHIKLVTVLAPQLGWVKADPSQLEQVIMNLALNARDAMPQGGKLTIETANVYLDEGYVGQHLGVEAGPYVRLAVSDTGLGMNAETQSRIFEPFFTTKEQGKGTGLGLATVYGIVNQSGGHILVYSEPGQGTTFKIYLPQVETTGERGKPQQASVQSGRGWETILLVEDEAIVREQVRRTLFKQGYTVLEAGDGEQARRLCAEHEGPIHLLLTDVVIPGGLTGVQLVAQLKLIQPAMKVLYMSGYTDNTITHNGILDPGVVFLPKPFTPGDLIQVVRQVLEAKQD